MNLALNKAELAKNIIKVVDETGDQKINYDDFIIMCQEIDTDKNGKITRKEVFKWLFAKVFKLVF